MFPQHCIASSKMQMIIATILFLDVALTQSDFIDNDCSKVHCRETQFDCPPDSEFIKITNEDDNMNFFDLLEAKGLIEEYNPNSTPQPEDDVENHKSIDLTFMKRHDLHRKRKRDISSAKLHPELEIRKCCPEFQCICRTCPEVPKCSKGTIAVRIAEGHNSPGSCCPKYTCIPDVECNAKVQFKNPYWRDTCTKCYCYSGHEICEQHCDSKTDDSVRSCFSEYLNKPMMNGDSWLEDDDCKECICIDGETRCEESFCKPLNCSHPIKVTGRCCKVCPRTIATTEPELTNTPELGHHTGLSESTTTPVPQTSSTPSSTESSSTSGPHFVSKDNGFETPFNIPTTIMSPYFVNCFIIAVVLTSTLVFGATFIRICLCGRHEPYSEIPISESSQSSSVTLA